MNELHLEARVVDLAARRVRGGDTEEVLTETEARLLAYLAGNPGRVVPRDELLAEVWGMKHPVVTRCVDTAVRRLRSKVEARPDTPRHLLKVHGSGYRFDPRGGPVPSAPVEPGAADLPVDVGPFYGRDAEIARIGRLLAAGSRVVLVAGPPGSGCSRLVREAARRHGGRFPGGVRRSAGAGALVVLDEPDPAALIACLDAGACVLAASAPLGHPEEQIVRIGPLSEEAGAALFRDRSGSDDAAIPDLVRALDGLPLAIVSAAARSGVLAPSDLIARSSDRFRLLGPALGASVRRAVDALEPSARDVLIGLSVFQGAFRLDTAEAVLGSAAVEALSTLMTRGLVEREPGVGPARFRLLATVRSWLPAADSGLRKRHLEAVLAWGEAVKKGWRGPRPDVAMDEIVGALDDFEAAHATALEVDPVAAVRILVVLDGPLLVRGPRDRHMALHDAMRAHLDRVPPYWKVEALTMRGEALRVAMRFADARVELVEAMRVADQVEDPVSAAHAIGYLAVLDHTEHRMERAEQGYREAIARLSPLRHETEGGYVGNLGQALVQMGRYDEAEPVLRRLLELRCREGNPLLEARARNELGWMLVEVGRSGEAESILRAAVGLWEVQGDRRGEASARNSLGLVLLDQGRWDEAIEVLEIGAVAARETGQLRSEAMALGYQGVALLLQGRIREAEARMRACVDVHRRSEQPWLAGAVTGWLAGIEASQGRIGEAEATFRDAHLAMESGFSADAHAMITVLEGLLDVARARRKRSEADGRALARERLRAAEPSRATSAENRLAARFVEACLDPRRPA